MKRIIGYFTVAAAIVLIGCSAQALFTSAYESATELWQSRIQGTQIVSVIVWEAGAVLAIGYCWRHKQRLLAFGGTILLLLAMAYTFSAELRLQAGTQENAVAKREAEVGRIELVKRELDKAIARRDYLQGLRKPTDGQQDELIAVSRQIEKLKASWEPLVETTRSAGIPGAALIARWTGINLADAGDIDAIIKMFFWTMVRVFALPIALSGASLVAASPKPASATDSSQQANVTPEALPAVTVRPVELQPIHPGLRAPLKSFVNALGAKSETQAVLSVADGTQGSHFSPDPDPKGGTPKELAPAALASNDSDQKSGLEELTSTVVTGPWPSDGKPKPALISQPESQKPDRKAKSAKPAKKTGCVKAWLEECTSQTSDKMAKATSGDMHRSYLALCHLKDEHPLGQKVFTRKVAAILKFTKKRDVSGQRIFPGLQVYHPKPMAKRAVA